jgi:hypothetical protein
MSLRLSRTEPLGAATILAGAILPTIYFAWRYLFPFPASAKSPQKDYSLSSLPLDSRHWEIFPEDFYGQGEYVELPHGRVKFWILGPDEGKKVGACQSTG